MLFNRDAKWTGGLGGVKKSARWPPFCARDGVRKFVSRRNQSYVRANLAANSHRPIRHVMGGRIEGGESECPPPCVLLQVTEREVSSMAVIFSSRSIDRMIFSPHPMPCHHSRGHISCLTVAQFSETLCWPNPHGAKVIVRDIPGKIGFRLRMTGRVTMRKVAQKAGCT